MLALQLKRVLSIAQFNIQQFCLFLEIHQFCVQQQHRIKIALLFSLFHSYSLVYSSHIVDLSPDTFQEVKSKRDKKKEVSRV
jgi:hypothetical protein